MSLRDFFTRPTRADLIARLDDLTRRHTDLTACARQDREDAWVANQAYNVLLADNDALTADRDRLRREASALVRENARLKIAQQQAGNQAEAEKERADRLATAAGLVAGAVDGEVIEDSFAASRALVTFRRVAARRPLDVIDTSFTGSWNRNDMILAAAEGAARRRGAA